MDLSKKRVLIIKPSSLGDVIHALPLVHALKRHYPDSHIGWVIQKNLAALIEDDPDVDEIISVEIPSTSEPSANFWVYFSALTKTFSCLKSLRSKFMDNPYDLVLDLHASFRSGLMVVMNPSGLRLGFADAKELNTFFQSNLISCGPTKIHAIDKILTFAEFLEIDAAPEDFRLSIAENCEMEALSFLEKADICAGRRIIYTNPATRWATKFWNERAWAELADKLIHDLDAVVILGGAPAELGYLNAIVSLMKQKPLMAAGRLSLMGAAALIKVSNIYVGVDSGPMHIAALLRRPVVALFGPTDPAKIGPYGKGHVVVRMEELPCLGCRKSACADKRCLDGISADRVFQEITELTGWS